MSKILKINRPSDYNAWLGQPDQHDLICVIDFSDASPMRYSLNHYEVYGLFLQGKEEGNEEGVDLVYGTGKYDNIEGTLICVAPGQVGGKEDNGQFFNITGWAVLFHPDLLQGTGLEHEIRNFSFFDYRINEALHMTAEERDIIISIVRQLKRELEFPADEMQDRILVGFLNSLLRYAQRFYNRQFLDKAHSHNNVLSKFEALLKDYFDSERQQPHGIPTLSHFARHLCMSTSNLSELIRKTTGETAGRFIKNYMIRLAKNRLAGGMTSSEVAYSLGFDYPQHFARTFKNMTGMTPKQYVGSRKGE